jgi:uncharacterized protein (TIGR02001 family)
MKLLSTCAAAAALALMASAGTASAQSAEISFNAAVTSDYMYRGFSQTNEDPAIQAGVDVNIGNFYAGAWASQVDFGDGTDAEIDLYGGFTWEAKGFSWDVGLITYLYAPGSNQDYDFVEVKAAVSRAVGPVTAGAGVYFSPDFYGADDEATYLEGNVEYAPIENFTISAALGKQWLSVGDDYTTWNIGGTYAFAGTPLSLDVRYHDTDVDNSPLADGRVNATLSVAF